jgi:hypothetical protein
MTYDNMAIPLSLMVRHEPASEAEEDAAVETGGHYGWAVVILGDTEVVKLRLGYWDRGEVSPRGALEEAVATWLAGRVAS